MFKKNELYFNLQRYSFIFYRTTLFSDFFLFFFKQHITCSFIAIYIYVVCIYNGQLQTKKNDEVN